MDEGVVGTSRASQPVEFGAIIANKYTVLRAEPGGQPGTFVCRESDVEPLRSVWILNPCHSLDPDGREFREDMGKVARLEHPQLRKVIDFGRDPSGVLYAAYEPLELRSLADLLEQDWPLTDERVVWLMCQLLATLEVAHAAGISHGDLRPENILVRSAGTVSQAEEIVVCGLGLAKPTRYRFENHDARPHLQLTEWMIGTPSYAAPEQFRGQPIDARSDVYGAGLLLFQLLTRTPAFYAASDLDTAWMQCFTPPPPPSGYGHVGPALEAVCLKALTKTPDVRYQSANEMRAALLEARARVSHSTRKRLSRTSQLPSVPAPAAGSSRKSSPSIVPAIVVADRRSFTPGALARASVEMTSERPIAHERQPKFRKPSAALLLMSSTLAIAAAVVLPELKLRERDAELVVEPERGTAPVLPAPAELPPIELPSYMRAATKAAPAVAVAPVEAEPQLPLTAAKAPSIDSIKPVAQLTAAKVVVPASPKPAPAAPNPVAAPARRVEPAQVKVRTIEKNVLAAEASVHEHTPVEMAAVTPEADAKATAPAQQPVLEVEAVHAQPQPIAAEQPAVAVVAPAAQPAAQPVAVAAPEPAPRPVVLTNTAPSTAASPAPLPRQVGIEIGEVTQSHGAVSRGALRAAFNQAALARCFRDAVQSGQQTPRNVNAEIEISTNAAGRVTAARVSGAGLQSNVVRCVEEAARLGRVREADTGELRATVGLTFFVR
jgi:serine/threonine-protein kinase